MAQARLTIFFAAAVVLCSTAAFTPAPAHSGHAARAGLLRHSGLEQQYTSKLRQHTGAGWLQRVRRAAVCARGALSATAAATPAPAAPPRWLRSVDVMGRVFYVNTASRATAWEARQLDAAQWREELRKRGAPDIYAAPPPPTAHGSADAHTLTSAHGSADARKLLQLPPVASPDFGA
ncbi:hypothetical protein EMIHUDRAFT_220753 [Emiliania huxleyi CCMP1516]|uniref:WW domain-containing protein n=2 Tax=Emiliania huxleyi TaxID=2903 RepID=A0A0D3I084_EMIH1|nr:hypothetical protein EMIHUDRAFT_220753 [Emiliania huxleyi CCMP1516]EOD04669.1 hypothetical protein EMIHUDRAFT_220753 [Emiliania huxleyi CCMP1516]|eukprot:XP_005757098.1 hypothetical protein EMIHUDRAFT_220753 [Emiliania huxleyi CCMP1516]